MMADEPKTPDTVSQDAGEASTQNDSTVVTADGLLNVEAFEDPTLKDAADAVNQVISERLANLAEREKEIEATKTDAENYRLLANNPEAVKYLFEKHFGKSKPADDDDKHAAPEVELDISDDEIIDAGKLRKLAKQLSVQTGQTVAQATKAIKDELLSAVKKELEPVRTKVQDQARQAAWSSLVVAHPEADTPEYRKEISKVLGSGRVARDDFEAAFFIVHGAKSRAKAVEAKASAAVSRKRAAESTQTAKTDSKRVSATSLSTKGKGWNGAVAAAVKKLGTLK